ncbi:MAG TPA: cytochrome c [Burkholderiaceae bacterium]|nr:cytochrome c [Burkholderiaceae bacterium]
MRVNKPRLKTMRWIGLCILAVASAALGQGVTYSTLERGRYLATTGNCASCHTADGGKPFAGGRAVPTPFGTIYSTNITPDRETGIGAWSNDEFYKAMHEGIRRDGQYLYPAFPYPWYTKLSARDVQAIKAYLGALPAVRQQNKPSELPWPLSVRAVMAGWNALFFREGSFRTDLNKSAQWNRGAYLVEGLGHCSACHTPKNVLGGLKKNQPLEGGFGEHWYASSLTGDLRDGLGSWSARDIVEYLKTGSNSKAAAAGPMTDVIRNSTQHLTDDDLNAIATYLKDMPRTTDENTQTVRALDPSVLSRGEALYVDNCTGCHMQDGAGLAQVFPPLKASAAVQASDPTTVLHHIMGGATMAATKEKPTGLAMPAFGWKLNDQEIAALATYIRNTWGNRADAVTERQVVKVRKDSPASAH